MTLPSGRIRDFDNIEILNRIRNDATSDYQRRIPAATKGSVADVVQQLTSYTPHFNEFTDALINRVGTYITRDITWNNPLREFKRGMLNFGDTIEEVQTGLVSSYTYNSERDYMEKDIFGAHKPNVASQFHTVNRQEYYKITVNRDQLRRAFLDESGLQNYLSQILASPTTSDQWDEFLLTCSLFAEYEKNGGFYHVKVPDLRSLTATESDAKQLIKRVRAMTDNLTFLSRQYNAARMETFAKREDLILIVTPEVKANIDVEALAAAFNLSPVDMYARVIPVPAEQMGIDKAQAILTTKDFFVIADNLLENTSQPNPVSLGTNYFLHHWEVISTSLFVPAVMFWTGDDDQNIRVRPGANLALGGYTATQEGKAVGAANKAIPGGNVEVTFAVTGDNTDGLELGIDYAVSGANSQRTKIDNDGILHLGQDEDADAVTVTATLVYRDSADVKKTIASKTASIAVDKAKAVKVWPKK